MQFLHFHLIQKFISLLFHVANSLFPTFRFYMQFLQRNSLSLSHTPKPHNFLVFVFKYCNGQFPDSGEYQFLNSRLALLWFCLLLIVPSALVNLIQVVIFDKFLVIDLTFFSISNNMLLGYSYQLTKNFLFVDKYFSIVTMHHQLNAFKIPRMVYCNHISLMISVNNVNYIHLLPIFSYCGQLLSRILHIANIISHSETHSRIIFILQQILVKLFFRYRIIDIL